MSSRGNTCVSECLGSGRDVRAELEAAKPRARSVGGEHAAHAARWIAGDACGGTPTAVASAENAHTCDPLVNRCSVGRRLDASVDGEPLCCVTNVPRATPTRRRRRAVPPSSGQLTYRWAAPPSPGQLASTWARGTRSRPSSLPLPPHSGAGAEPHRRPARELDAPEVVLALHRGHTFRVAAWQTT